MPSEATKPDPAALLPSGDDQKQKHQLDREIKEMITALTRHLGELQNVNKRGGTTSQDDEDDHGVRIITLTGSNYGATMQSALEDIKASDNSNPQLGVSLGGGGGDDQDQDQEGEESLSTYANSNIQAINNSIMMGGSYSTNDPESLSTYANSNIQAINNSIMMGGSYSTNDPGVHVDVSEYIEHQAQSKQGKKVASKKKDKETYKSDQHSEYSG
ncbi:unnamed protein product [Ilex paraguariensis]|uniref:Uncharacterized protein n=1 Tax=Ilex paraguariensis TaxID=185542 RepID=A0ABC8TR33_9AQUA